MKTFTRSLPYLCLLLAAACAPPPVIGCEDVRCSHGECVARSGEFRCACSPEELDAGLTCEVVFGPDGGE